MAACGGECTAIHARRAVLIVQMSTARITQLNRPRLAHPLLSWPSTEWRAA